MKNHITHTFFLLLFIFTIDIGSMVGNDSSINQTKEIDRWLSDAKNKLKTNPNDAYFFASKAKEKSHQIGDITRETRALYLMANAMTDISNFDSAMPLLYSADEICPKWLTGLKTEIINSLATLYCKLGDYDMAIKLNEQSITISKINQDSLYLADSYNTRGIIHTYQRQAKEAKYYLLKSLSINRKINNSSGVAANLNNLCLMKRTDINLYLKYIDEALSINQRSGNKWDLAENYNNKGRQLYFAKKYHQAIKALNKGKELALEIQSKELLSDYNEYMAEIYQAMGRYKEALHAQQKLMTLREDMLGSDKLRNVERRLAEKKRLRVETQRKLERQSYEIKLLKQNIIIIFVLFVTSLVVSWLILQRRKRRHEMNLKEARMQQQVKLLEDKKEQLSSLALFIKSRNEVFERIKEELKKTFSLKAEKQTQQLRQLYIYIQQVSQSTSPDSNLQKQIEIEHEDFLVHLKEKHHDLSAGERHLAMMVRVNLNTKEIAVLLGVQPKTVNMNRYRLRKKLGLINNENLLDYLRKI